MPERIPPTPTPAPKAEPLKDAICAVILRPRAGSALDPSHPLREPVEVLMIERAAGQTFAGHWTPVTGACLPGEAPALAVVREVKEEVGLRVHAVRKIWECPTSTNVYRLHWWLAQLTPSAQTVEPDPREVAAYAWMTPEAVTRLGRTFADTRAFFAAIETRLGG